MVSGTWVSGTWVSLFYFFALSPSFPYSFSYVDDHYRYTMDPISCGYYIERYIFDTLLLFVHIRLLRVLFHLSLCI